MFAEIAGILAPVFACALIGFCWEKRGLPFNVQEITPLIVNIGTPALVVSTLLNADLDLDLVGEVAGYALLFHALAFITGFAAVKAARREVTSFLPSMMFPNTGNMGLSICLFAFGEFGLALAIAFFSVTSVMQFTVGAAISSGQVSAKRIVTSPLVWGVAVSVTLIALNLSLPHWAMNTVDLIGGLTIPMMLIGLGVSLARLKVGALTLSMIFAILRVGGGCLIGVGIAAFFGLEGAMRGVVILQCSMPVAVFNYLFATYYGRDSEAVAGLVVVSTVVSFAALPALLWLVLPG